MEHVRPFGCRVLYSELVTLFPDEEVEVSVESFYESRGDIGSWNSNLLMIDEYLQLDSLELNALFNYVTDGGTVLMSAYDFPSLLLDTFGISLATDFRVNEIIRGGYKGSEIVHNFQEDRLRSDTGYVMMLDASIHYFMAIDSLDKCDGIAWVENEEKVNFVRKPIGDGELLLHSNPYIFSNFNMLSEEGSSYVSGVLSHLPEGGIVWDEYHKKVNLSKRGSILNVVLSDPALKKAIYLSVIGILLILLFMSKRKQRIIKDIEVFSNDSKELVSTIGNMYYNTSENKEIVGKKIQLFKQEMFRRHGLRDISPTDETINRLAERTGITSEELKSNLLFINQSLQESKISDHNLKKINNIINAITHGKQYGIKSAS